MLLQYTCFILWICTVVSAEGNSALACFLVLHCTSGELLQCTFLFPDFALHFRRTFGSRRQCTCLFPDSALHFWRAFGSRRQYTCLILGSAMHFRRNATVHLLNSGLSNAFSAQRDSALACFLVLHCTSGELSAQRDNALACFRILHCTSGELLQCTCFDL